MKAYPSLGDSTYQTECKRYYAVLRELHNAIFTSPERMKSEKTEERYSDGNVSGIENLYTFITMLVELMHAKKTVQGVDYGCGSHYFVDDMTRNPHWDVIGFDSDDNAINNAKAKYPQSADRYRCRDLLKDGVPLPGESQDFVFCNAVIQHFSDEEVEKSFIDISRILKKDGILLIIFKNKIDDFSSFSHAAGLESAILDANAGMIEIEDRTMKKAMEALDPRKKELLPEKYQKGMRLFHFFSVPEIEELGKRVNLKVIEKIGLGDAKHTRGVFTYNSGKKIPAAAMFFTKNPAPVAK
jgi:SAM-dependent methyltransferase